MQSRCDPLIERGVGQQVARDLFDRELVEGHVLVKSLDQPVPVGPDAAPVVFFIAVRIGIAHKIEPGPGPPFPVVRRSQEPVYDLLIRIRASVGQKCVDFRQARRKSDEVQARAANQCFFRCFRQRTQSFFFKPGEDKTVDGIANPGRILNFRRIGPFGFDVSPMLPALRRAPAEFFRP